jgi:hypothetical protein
VRFADPGPPSSSRDRIFPSIATSRPRTSIDRVRRRPFDGDF